MWWGVGVGGWLTPTTYIQLAGAGSISVLPLILQPSDRTYCKSESNACICLDNCGHFDETINFFYKMSNCKLKQTGKYTEHFGRHPVI